MSVPDRIRIRLTHLLRTAGFSVPPAAIAEVVDHLPMRPPATLTAALCPAEADRHRQLVPVNRVEEAVLGPDRYGGGTVPPGVKEA